MHFGLLGPLLVEDSGLEIEVSSPKQRALLALLLVHANEVLSTDRILEELWGDAQPAGGTNALRFHVSRLRGTVGDNAGLVTRAPGYVLEVDKREKLDILAFEDRAREGRALLKTDAAAAGRALRDALDLWRGRPLGDFDENFAAAESERLFEVRRGAIADRIEADLASGQSVEVVAELEGLVGEHPLDERLSGLLMVALYRTGRQADALRVYRTTRSVLGTELGIEPSPSLQQIEEQVLLQSPQLEPPAALVATTHLPHYATGFVGRKTELRDVGRLIDSHRLVTLAGPGGIGKTRIAVHVARRREGRYRHGAILVDLTTVHDDLEVPRVLAEALGVKASGALALDVSIAEHVSKREILLLIDNCEPVIAGLATLVQRLIEAAPSLTVLATSREPLGVAGEHVLRVPPLSVKQEGTPDEPDAVLLFMDCVERRRPGFEFEQQSRATALRICERLEGIPLAIELASSWLRALSLPELEQRLNHRFSLLSSGDRATAPRHKAIETTLDWSYSHLDEIERALFRRLSTFRGGFDLAAAEGCSSWLSDRPLLDVLARLVDASMVTVDTGHPARYAMLETIREYSQMKLRDEGEAETAHANHAAYFGDLIATGAQVAKSGEADWLARLGTDEPNIRAAFDWTIEHGDSDRALEIGADIGEVWFHLGYHNLASRNLVAAVEQAENADPKVLLRALSHMARIATWRGNAEEAADLTDRMRELANSTNDPTFLTQSLAFQAVAAWGRGEFRRARDLLADAVDEVDVGAPERVRWLAQMSFLSSWMGEVREARRILDDLMDLRPHHDPVWIGAFVADAQGTVRLQVGELEAAATHFGEARPLYERLGLRVFVCDMLQSEASALIDLGRLKRAIGAADAALALAGELDDTRMLARCVLVQGQIALAAGDAAAAHERLVAAIHMSRASGDRVGVIWALLALATHASAIGDQHRVIRLHGVAESTRLELEPHAYALERAAGEIGIARETLGPDLADEAWQDAVAAGYEAVAEFADSYSEDSPSLASMSASTSGSPSGGT